MLFYPTDEKAGAQGHDDTHEDSPRPRVGHEEGDTDGDGEREQREQGIHLFRLLAIGK
ncbi:MAG: hypothetical protein LC754_19630 [Acidobacteria bacterium]|nr:hypothetical protein [Acidobacteriota bacterium]